MSTQKNFRLSDRTVKALKVISEFYDWSETKTIEYLVNLYVDQKCSTFSECTALQDELLKAGL